MKFYKKSILIIIFFNFIEGVIDSENKFFNEVKKVLLNKKSISSMALSAMGSLAIVMLSKNKKITNQSAYLCIQIFLLSYLNRDDNGLKNSKSINYLFPLIFTASSYLFSEKIFSLNSLENSNYLYFMSLFPSLSYLVIVFLQTQFYYNKHLDDSKKYNNIFLKNQN